MKNSISFIFINNIMIVILFFVLNY